MPAGLELRETDTPYREASVEGTVPAGPWSDRILIDTLHDGVIVPPRFVRDGAGRDRLPLRELEARFVRERDWGANLVAHELARALGVGSYHRVEIARVLLDFNRFPGSTPEGHDVPLERLAIHPPFTDLLSHREKSDLLADAYDGISAAMEPHLAGKMLKIAVHTYDEHNPSRTQRPDVSLISRSWSYQQHSRMPVGVFDPLYPDVLGESTCNRTLIHRLSLHFERAGFRLGHNHPYLLPDGSLEVRTQVWYFFRFLRERFETEFPDARENEEFEMVWTMLLNTNLRLAESDALKGYFDRFRVVGPARRDRFRAARAAYEQLSDWVRDSDIVTEYRRSRTRPSSLALEVRKDLLVRFDPETGRPLPLEDRSREIARQVADVFAEAIRTYFETDRDRSAWQAPPP